AEAPPPAPPLRLRQAPTRSVPPLDESIARLYGVGPRALPLYAKLGIETVRDALEYYPKDYLDRSKLLTISDLRYGSNETFIATVRKVENRRLPSANLLTATLVDGTGSIESTWFSRGYVRQDLQPGMEMIFTGKVGQYQGRLKVESPEYENLDKELLHSGRIVPVYRLTAALTGRSVRRVVHDVVSHHAPYAEEFLPDWVIDRAGLIELPRAYHDVHFPDSWEDLEAARRRLGFDEFLELQLGALLKQAQRRAQSGAPEISASHPDVDSFLAGLPFRLTEAQQRATNEILADLGRSSAMVRMLQGDVGSGKTVVAATALVAAAAAGCQAALMAPTEILAEQHYRGLEALFATMGDRAPRTALLTGSHKGKARAETYSALQSARSL
ncbi:MAG: DEAD/DEAH box helicase, partial [Chloroflexia bacterium]